MKPAPGGHLWCRARQWSIAERGSGSPLATHRAAGLCLARRATNQRCAVEAEAGFPILELSRAAHHLVEHQPEVAAAQRHALQTALYVARLGRGLPRREMRATISTWEKLDSALPCPMALLSSSWKATEPSPGAGAHGGDRHGRTAGRAGKDERDVGGGTRPTKLADHRHRAADARLAGGRLVRHARHDRCSVGMAGRQGCRAVEPRPWRAPAARARAQGLAGRPPPAAPAGSSAGGRRPGRQPAGPQPQQPPGHSGCRPRCAGHAPAGSGAGRSNQRCWVMATALAYSTSRLASSSRSSLALA